MFWQGQPKQLYDALTCPKTYLCFTAEEGRGTLAGHTLFHQRAFEDDVLLVDARRNGAVPLRCG